MFCPNCGEEFEIDSEINTECRGLKCPKCGKNVAFLELKEWNEENTQILKKEDTREEDDDTPLELFLSDEEHDISPSDYAPCDYDEKEYGPFSSDYNDEDYDTFPDDQREEDSFFDDDDEEDFPPIEPLFDEGVEEFFPGDDPEEIM